MASRILGPGLASASAAFGSPPALQRSVLRDTGGERPACRASRLLWFGSPRADGFAVYRRAQSWFDCQSRLPVPPPTSKLVSCFSWVPSGFIV